MSRCSVDESAHLHRDALHSDQHWRQHNLLKHTLTAVKHNQKSVSEISRPNDPEIKLFFHFFVLCLSRDSLEDAKMCCEHAKVCDIKPEIILLNKTWRKANKGKFALALIHAAVGTECVQACVSRATPPSEMFIHASSRFNTVNAK